MRRTFVCSFIAVLAGAPLRATEMPVWQTEWSSAFKIAREQHRVVFVDYFLMACPPSKVMEEAVLTRPDVQQRLTDFVLLRIDLSRQSPSSTALPTFPAYFIYDAGERERFRLPRAEAHAAILERCVRSVTPTNEMMAPGSVVVTRDPRPACCDAIVANEFNQWLDTIRGAAPSFARAAEMIDSGKELDADYMLANTYAHFHEFGYASAMYEKARALAEKSGDKATAQILEAQSAFLVARQGNPKRAITLLQKIAATPVNRDNEALIWLTLGHAYRLAKDQKAAGDAYKHAQSIADPESRTYKEATAAIAKLQ